MAELCLSNSTDNPSNVHLGKESISLDARHVNSFIRRSLSNKLNILAVTPSSTMTTTSASSTRSLAMTCADLDSATRSIQRHQSTVNTTSPTDEVHVLNDDVKQHESSTNVNKRTSLNDSDSDWFDDEEETVVAESLYSSLSPSVPNSAPMVCPICYESATLQSPPCCTFQCCNSCWRSHISASINDGRIKISCSSNECNKYLTRETIVNFIRHDIPLHERYLKLYANANQNPRAKTCE